MVFMHKPACTFNQFRIQADTLCYRKSIGTARFTNDKLIHGLQTFLIKGHSSVYNAGCFICHHLKVQVMRCYDPECMSFYQFLQDHFSKRSSQIWITSAAQFVDKEKSTAAGLFHKMLHIDQV